MSADTPDMKKGIEIPSRWRVDTFTGFVMSTVPVLTDWILGSSISCVTSKLWLDLGTVVRVGNDRRIRLGYLHCGQLSSMSSRRGVDTARPAYSSTRYSHRRLKSYRLVFRREFELHQAPGIA